MGKETTIIILGVISIIIIIISLYIIFNVKYDNYFTDCEIKVGDLYCKSLRGYGWTYLVKPDNNAIYNLSDQALQDLQCYFKNNTGYEATCYIHRESL